MLKIHHLALGCALTLTLATGCSKSGDTSASTASAPASAMAPAGAPKVALSDLDFAKTGFTKMTTGDASVESEIDWDNFNAQNQDVGAMYGKFSKPEEQAAFRQSFLSSFAQSFQKQGASAANFTNWRVTVTGELPGQTIVIADAPSGKSLQVNVQKINGEQKLQLIGVG